jgi:hypothetical protein
MHRLWTGTDVCGIDCNHKAEPYFTPGIRANLWQLLTDAGQQIAPGWSAIQKQSRNACEVVPSSLCHTHHL